MQRDPTSLYRITLQTIVLSLLHIEFAKYHCTYYEKMLSSNNDPAGVIKPLQYYRIIISLHWFYLQQCKRVK